MTLRTKPAPVPLRGVLVFADGHRHELALPQVGGQRYHWGHGFPDGRELEVIFEADPEPVDGCIIYREVSREVREP